MYLLHLISLLYVHRRQYRHWADSSGWVAHSSSRYEHEWIFEPPRCAPERLPVGQSGPSHTSAARLRCTLARQEACYLAIWWWQADSTVTGTGCFSYERISVDNRGAKAKYCF